VTTGARRSALHRGVFAAPGRAFSRGTYPGVSELLAGGRSAPGRNPGAARELGGCVHPPPAGAASDPAITTPHESALGGSDDVEYNPILSYVNGDIAPASLAADSAPGIAYNAAIHSRVRPASQFE